MRIVALLLYFLVLGGCTGILSEGSRSFADLDKPALQSIHQDLTAKFSFVHQPIETDVYRHHSGHTPFEGDCDDYQSAAKYRLLEAGYTPLAVTGFAKDRSFHVFTCALGATIVCLDPNYSHVQLLSTLRQVYRKVTVYEYDSLSPFRAASAGSLVSE